MCSAIGPSILGYQHDSHIFIEIALKGNRQKSTSADVEGKQQVKKLYLESDQTSTELSSAPETN